MSERNIENCLLLVFDFDGVLANSQVAYSRQMQETVEYFTQKKIPLEVFLQRGGNTDQAQDFIEFLGTNDIDAIDQAIVYYVSLTEKYSYLRELYPNVRSILEELRKTHLVGLVSRKSQERMLKWLHHFKITHLFDRPIGTLENSKAKAIGEIRAEFRIPTDRTIMVGDTEFDIKGAKDAGVSSVLALYGAEKPEAALALSPTYTINSIEEILEISNNHLNS